ncbi:thioredoxin [Kipferlia bialata]|uniref:Thioredoxin n=1 Tax=Kipferlia bialata TaxID=797122 RepID=A0A9K3D4I5_9EUKA|nr:thioredoxin [Kipferlia bialata]|eukprot:g11311.t1
MSDKTTEVITVESRGELDRHLQETSLERLVVVEFSALWCGPCRRIVPDIKRWAKDDFPQVTFLEVDVDQQAEIAADFSIQAMPTFKLYRGGKEVAELVGANLTKIQSSIKQHYGR